MVERPPLPADATPIGRDWVEYADDLEAKLRAYEAFRERMESAAGTTPLVTLPWVLKELRAALSGEGSN